MPAEKRFRLASTPRNAPLYTSQPSDRRTSPWYVWDAANDDPGEPKPVFVGSMEECQAVAAALMEVHGDGW